MSGRRVDVIQRRGTGVSEALVSLGRAQWTDVDRVERARLAPDRFFEIEAGQDRFIASAPYNAFVIRIVKFGIGYGF